ncbi:hypothetical protein KBK19_02150 [Microvirga sp. STR05]|uniref:Uncharacterized protein n=1 Tax=Hymenobacter duratus TaxID=2771356 RepID=A0ABR8JCV7_9BACT|nr:hypothetical protein [Hymenobacter duratus]MBD2713832.1 hypothetical protein [Hymenobacter duratus]MBR7948734.1 hypothetical protein [Microvirga sp. STR05]
MKLSFLLSLLGLAMLGSCQQTPSAESPQAPSEQQAQEQTSATGAPTATAARAAVGRYLQGQPNAALYVLDSASVLEVDDHWQVLVLRTDWAGRMPNRAAFEVDKSTGTVSPLAVKYVLNGHNETNLRRASVGKIMVQLPEPVFTYAPPYI